MIGRSPASFVLSIGAAAFFASDLLRAQCQHWQSGHSAMGTDGAVFTTCVFDDGSGPAIYAGGVFHRAGSDAVADVAKWDGTRWSPLGLGTNGAVQALAVFDDGSGSALYVAGDFTSVDGLSASHIARWNGQRWSTLGSGANNSVDALCVFDDGSGPALYAGGAFNSIDGIGANSIAKWNGTAWSPLGSGADPLVLSLAVFDDGSGPALFAGGTFQNAGGASANRVAKWNGSMWSPLGSGTNDNVFALEVFDDGSGAKLYAGGSFTAAGGGAANRVARWDGSTWSAVGSGFNNTVLALTASDLGGGTALYAGGDFTGASGSGVSQWNSTSWSPLGIGIVGGGVHSLTGFDDGNGPALFIGGSFVGAGSGIYALNSRGIVKWDGANWAGVGGGTDADVDSLAVFDDGTGPALYVGGKFQSAGSVSAKHIAKYKNGRFTPLGAGLGPETYPTPSATFLAVFDDGTGPALYVGGSFHTAGGISSPGLARWNGSAWSAVSTAAPGGTFNGGGPMTVFDDGAGKRLFVAGVFTPSPGPTGHYAIAKWDGSTWNVIGDTSSGNPNALTVFDDGSGPLLYAAGSFSHIGGIAADFIARWNGSTWSPISISPGSGTGIRCLAVFDDGTGSALYAGGDFSMLGGAPTPAMVAKWNGSWSGVGNAAISNNSKINTMRVFDDGSGSGAGLYVAGSIYTIGGVVMRSIARWSGTSWSPLPPGLGSWLSVQALAEFDDSSGNGPALWAGGSQSVDIVFNSGGLAAWQGCGHPGEIVCLGDGTGGACPCDNYGLPGHGCRNSSQIRGAELTASGLSSLSYDSLAMASAFEPHNVTSIFLQGDQLISPVPFGDGLRCAGGHLKRLFTVNATSGGTASVPPASGASISARSLALGDPIDAGTLRVYQMYYRDSNLAFCPAPLGNSWNVSNGLRVSWTP
jgi:hypothetical protein